MKEKKKNKKKYIKIYKLKKKGFNFPNKFKIKNKICNLYKFYNKFKKNLLKINKNIISISGRIISKRIMGKASFSNIRDYFKINSFPDNIQIYLSKNILKDKYDEFKKFDIGDFINIKGVLFETKTKELTIKVKKIFLVSKSIRLLPDKFSGLLNKEIKYRKRYIDLIINKNTRNIFYKRSKIITLIRKFMEKNNFLEVETPMLHYLPGGANAKPFITFHNSLNTKMFLRISPELYLKRLIIGGLNKIYEINRNFRNEGISSIHNPEFTMMEFYCAYTNYIWCMKFTEKIIKKIALFNNNLSLINYKNKIIDFNKPFQKLTIEEALIKYNFEYTKKKIRDINFILLEIKKYNINLKKTIFKKNIYDLQLILFENTVESKLLEPTFIIHYPVSNSPLARKTDKNKKLTERFELYISGYEIANGFSELNDPEEQYFRFIKQTNNKKKYDKDYIKALEYGMPPTSGCGIGIDRIIMLFTNSKNIKDVIFFPSLKKN